VRLATEGDWLVIIVTLTQCRLRREVMLNGARKNKKVRRKAPKIIGGRKAGKFIPGRRAG